MEFGRFERELLRLAFTTDIELSPSSLAFVTGIPIAQAARYLSQLVDQGVLELSSSDGGHLQYVMPDRPPRPLPLDHPALVGARHVSTQILADPGLLVQVPPRALVVRRMMPARWDEAPCPTRTQALTGLLVNALVCPGAGSLLGGRTHAGLAQLALFLAGLPLTLISIGFPLIIAAWIWAVVTGAQMVSDARDL